MYCVFDLETTGLPETKSWMQYHDPYEQDKYTKCKIIEVGYVILDSEMNIQCKKSLLVYPDCDITNDHIHGITTEFARTNGRDAMQVYHEFQDDLSKYKCKYLISHNIKFDYNVLLSNLIMTSRLRTFVVSITKMKKKCTMVMGKYTYGMSRFPKLSVLYETLTKKEWTQKHRALDDAEKCAVCFTMMWRETHNQRNTNSNTRH